VILESIYLVFEIKCLIADLEQTKRERGWPEKVEVASYERGFPASNYRKLLVFFG